MDEEDLERINQEIEEQLEQGVITDDEDEADQASNRHVNVMMIIAILFSIAVIINIGFIVFRLVKLLF